MKSYLFLLKKNYENINQLQSNIKMCAQKKIESKDKITIDNLENLFIAAYCHIILYASLMHDLFHHPMVLLNFV